MRIKRSLIEKKEEARELSLRNKDTVYYVIDKNKFINHIYSFNQHVLLSSSVDI